MRFLFLILTGLLIAPLAGLGTAMLYELASLDELQTPRALLVMGLFLTTFITLACVYFYRYFSPLTEYTGQGDAQLNETQQGRLARFGRDYWSCFLLYALAIPPMWLLATGQPVLAAPAHLLQLLLLQLSVVILVGLPIYQLALDQIGRLS